ncbi:hypothetical protein JQM60_03625 [Butyricicoccus pullicaecorum]|nr:hypothetical protein [Butyricicoccus pullicaecorum]
MIHDQKTLLREARQQKDALVRLSRWMQGAMLLSSCAAVLAWWGLTGAGLRFACGVTGVVLAIASAMCAALIGLGIRNGKRNVNHILRAAEAE